MAVESRTASVIDLQRALDRPAQPIWDQKRDPWDTRRRALLAYDPGSTHLLCLQDDAIVCRDLVAGLESALEALQARTGTTPPLSLYLGRVRPWGEQISALVESLDPETTWVRLPELIWGVGMVLPVDIIPELVAWCDKHPEAGPGEDRRIGKFLASKEMPTWHTWPSLVDHREGPSIIHGNRRTANERRAHWFIGEEASALSVDWAGAVHVVHSLRRYPPPHRWEPRPEPPRPERRDAMPEVRRTEPWPEGLIMRARKTALVDDGPKRRRITKGVTTAHSTAPIVVAKPHLWEELVVDFPGPTEPEAPAAPMVKVQIGDNFQLQPAPPAPEDWRAYRQSPEVREWAQANGYSVAPQGFIGKATIEAYLAARANANA